MHWRFPCPYALVLGVFLALALAAAPAKFGAEARLFSTMLAQAQSGKPAWDPGREEIRRIQQRLQELGFDPGPIDGAMGPRTRSAITEFQRSRDQAVTGRASLELYQALTASASDSSGAAETAETSPPAALPEAVEGHPTAGATDCRPQPLGTWAFEDALGSAFELKLQEDGEVGGPFYDNHWRWQASGDQIEILYDNGMGLSVTRSGTLDSFETMTGEASDSRGKQWAWRARRIASADGTAPAAGCVAEQ